MRYQAACEWLNDAPSFTARPPNSRIVAICLFNGLTHLQVRCYHFVFHRFFTAIRDDIFIT